MSLRFQKFVEDRNYALAKLTYVGVIAIIIFAIYHIFLMVSEVKKWDTAEQYPGTTISVVGEAEVFAVPDIATFSFSVNATKDSVTEAQTESAAKINAITAYLKEQGVEDRDVKTISYNAYPQYDYTPCLRNFCEQTQTLRGYEVSQQIQVKVRDTTKAGEILSGVGSQGATNVSGLTFEIDNPEALQAEARSKAIANAQKEAKQLAKDLDVKLDDVVSFYEETNDYYPKANMMRSEMSFDGGAAIAPELPAGENVITARVNITYEIE